MIAKTNFFSYPLIVFAFAIVGANFSEARAAREFLSPQPPSFPRRPSGQFWEVSRNCVSNFAQNGFALNSEYAPKR